MAGLKTKPYKYQEEAIRKALKKKFFALFMEQGTGKTLTSLGIIAARIKKIKWVLVFCPKVAIEVWRDELREHFNIRYHIEFLEELKDNSRTLKRYVDAQTTLKFLIVTHGASWRSEKILRRIPWDMVIVDESHRIARPKSKQSKAIHRVGRPSRYRLILTGTPVGNDEIDLWSQFRFLIPKLLGDNWEVFETRWCKKFGWELLKRALKKHLKEKYLKKLAPYTHRVEAREVLDLPPETHQYIHTEMTGKSLKIYEELKEKFLVEIGDDLLVTKYKVTQMMKLHQITGGFVRLEDGRDIEIQSNKFDALADWLEDWPKDKPLVIFCNFISEIERIGTILKRRKIKWGYIGDGHSDYKAFKSKKTIDTLIVQIASATSINLTRASTAIFYSTDFSYYNYNQALKRLVRNLQKSKVIFVHFLQKKTIDIYIQKAIKRKSSIADYVISRLRKGR